ncbi:beta strand repeat-containing protein [Massilia sp. S19_KUP03_FR1]|uniref:beta strand repeat-containing protein n=1 Tax=Massilia sp. S19_KUP03_FR1 TaxID=3025503 RepID=UPI002FCDDE84
MPTPQLPPLRSSATLRVVLASAFLMTMASASATPFTITGTTTTGQTLGSGSGQTGTVAAGGALTVGGSTVGVAVTGNNATLNNLGTIAQTGTGRAIRDNTGVANLVVNNGSVTNGGATIRTNDADVIQMNVPAASVTLNNYGALVSLNASAGGAQAVDFSSMTGANVLNNYAGGVITASEADAVRPGAGGVVNNAGTIRSTTPSGSSSDGIDGQGNSGIRITNASTGVIEGGRHGITGGPATGATDYAMSVTNDAGGVVRGSNGAGINLDGFNAKQVATIVNRGSIVGNGVTGDGDGIDVDGMVNITNSGLIRSSNAVSAPASGLAYSEGISAGGGSIVNAGRIEGLVAAGNTNAVGRGITLAGNDLSNGTREGIYGNATVINQAGGLIRGDSDSAIVGSGVASGYTITINNNAGATILGGGATNAAIRVLADRTVVNNAGTINGASSGKAIELGSGNNQVIISGGNAVVTGSVNGGAGGTNTMALNVGAGNTFAYDGGIANFNRVSINSGAVTFSGQSSYTGATVLNGGSLRLVGADRIAAASALVLNGGLLNVVEIGSGQTFASLSLEDSATIYYSDTPLTFSALGNIVSGKTLTLTDVFGGTGTALRFIGDISGSASFLDLIGALRTSYGAYSFNFDGTYTNVAQVPEPGTVALMGAGLVLLAVRGGRTQRREHRASKKFGAMA